MASPTIDPISYNAGIETCRFCGSADVHVFECEDETVGASIFWVECESCSARGPTSEYKDGSVIHWNARTEPQTAPDAPAVTIKPMKLSDGRTDFFVSIRVCGREVTPHVYREEYKAAYHVALYNWLLNGGEKPDLMAFNPGDFPAQPVADTAPADAERLALADRLENHVRSRLPGSEPVIQNGAWQMMLDAAKLLRAGGWREDMQS